MDMEIARGDTMINPKFKTPAGQIATHDIVVANPMWNQPFSPELFANDPFDRFRTAGGATTGKGDWAWLQHTLACLNERGRAAVVLDTGAVTRGSSSRKDDKERNIRKWFVDHDLIDGVILLPDNLFYNTSSAAVIVLLSQRKPPSRQGRIVLLNAGRHVRKGRPKNYIPEDEIRPIASAFLKGEPVTGEIAIITRQQAKKADYNLSPSRWAGQTETVVQRPIEDIIAELRRLDAEARKIDASLVSAGASAMVSESWPWRALGELFEIGAGKTMSAAARNGANKTPFLRTSNVLWDEIDLSSVDEMSIPEHELATKLLRPGDLLVCEGGEIGRAAVWNGEVQPMSFQNHIHRLRPIGEDVEPRFYVYFLQSAFTQLGIFEGAGNKTTIPNLSRSRLAALEVPQPTIDEQQAIVEELARVRNAIHQSRKTREVLNHLFSALLHKFMTGTVDQ